MKLKKFDFAYFLVIMAFFASITGLFIRNLTEQSVIVLCASIQTIGTLAAHHDENDKEDKK